uniref:Uncharacterized protein n=1 Tax=Megaselia scalaris TaxID=36166 RepID=T1GZ24_MEGSC
MFSCTVNKQIERLAKFQKSLIDVARTSLTTKLHPKLADILTEVSFGYATQNNHRLLYCYGYGYGSWRTSFRHTKTS